jgi:hypothetical protein
MESGGQDRSSSNISRKNRLELGQFSHASRLELVKLLSCTHCKKSERFFPSPVGMSLTKLSLAGNNLIREFGK